MIQWRSHSLQSNKTSWKPLWTVDSDSTTKIIVSIDNAYRIVDKSPDELSSILLQLISKVTLDVWSH